MKPITLDKAIAQLRWLKREFQCGADPLMVVDKSGEYVSFMPISRIELCSTPEACEKFPNGEPVVGLFGFEATDHFNLPPDIPPPTPHLKVVKP